MILVSWPDPTFLEGLLFGFPAVGYSPHIPIYLDQDAQYLSPADVLTDAWPDAQSLLATLKPSEFDEEIHKAGVADEAANFCGPAWSWEELCGQGHRFRLTRWLCIKQPSGKLRVIDDAASGGQSALSSDRNKLDLCSAIQPGLNAKLLWQYRHLQAALDDRLETGGPCLPFRSYETR